MEGALNNQTYIFTNIADTCTSTVEILPHTWSIQIDHALHTHTDYVLHVGYTVLIRHCGSREATLELLPTASVGYYLPLAILRGQNINVLTF